MKDISLIRTEYLNLLDKNVEEKGKEEQIQKFLEEYPILLPILRPYDNIIFRKMRLSKDMICDFAFAREDSLGLRWHFIELEKPWCKQYTADGSQHSELTKGIQQVLKWKTWFRDYRLSIVQELPFRKRAAELGLDEPSFTLIFGRRSGITDENRKDLREIRINSNIDIMSFDRLADDNVIFVYPEEYGNELKTCSIHGREIKVLSTFNLEGL